MDAGAGQPQPADPLRDVALAKSALSQSQVLATALYLAAIGLMCATRAPFFTAVSPRPPRMVRDMPNKDGPDLWVTSDISSLIVAVCWACAIALLHFQMIASLLLKRPPGMPRLSLKIGWILPLALFFVSSGSFMIFTKMSRYGPSIYEWCIAGALIFGLLAFTVGLLVKPIKMASIVLAAMGIPVAQPNPVVIVMPQPNQGIFVDP